MRSPSDKRGSRQTERRQEEEGQDTLGEATEER